MGAAALEAAALGKRYRLNARSSAGDRLSESLSGLLRLRAVRAQRSSEWFWALRDVTFDVEQGSAVGVIGRNGAGKSTLLKILSRVTIPTEGHVRIRGRAASLLEVGTGFHPELTGRENVFMSGAILGMSRSETRRKFDQIVEFAGVEPFIDMPLKRYSTGMQVRLGFAVAAHLEPEILFIDEVLAVGDAEFQRRCLGKMTDIGQEGRTIVFVSHSMPAVLRLCDRAILLDRGRVVTSGSTSHVVRAYLESDLGRTGERRWSMDEAPGDAVAKLVSVRVVNDSNHVVDEIDVTQPLSVEVVYWSDEPGRLRPVANLHFYNEEGTCLFVTSDPTDVGNMSQAQPSGLVRVRCRIPANFLAEGRVLVTAYISTFNPLVAHVTAPDAVAFQVVDRSVGDAVRGEYVGDWPGVVRPMFDWEHEIVGSRPPD